jgi:hypothetical protein
MGKFKVIDDTTVDLGGVFTTVRACLDCGALISGGPTRCLACIRHGEKTTGPVVDCSEAKSCSCRVIEGRSYLCPKCAEELKSERDRFVALYREALGTIAQLQQGILAS